MKLSFQPIGYLRGGGRYSCEAPRQGTLAANRGVIELEAHCNYEMAAADLAGFDRIWVIFLFDRSAGWRPKVRPPVTDGARRIGVFATRAPHRPNPIGMSAVRLLEVAGRMLTIADFDLLDGTPILDIKPYIPEADAFPHAATGWRGAAQAVARRVDYTPAAAAAIAWLRERGAIDLGNVCQTQLATLELNPKRQRLHQVGEAAWILACRTWRIHFTRNVDGAAITVTAIGSGYTADELLPGAPDPYLDKDLHRAYLRCSAADA